MDKDRFDRQLRFILEADKEKNILRQTHLSGHGRRENDSEHAWHMALMAYLLREYSNEEIDIAKTMLMCLIHDIVEIDAGDTYAYDDDAKETQTDRERQAAERLFGMLPADQGHELRTLFEEFESQSTPEARFARAMDNFQPLLLNDSNGGSDWLEHQVRYDQVMKRHDETKPGSRVIYDRSVEMVDRHREKGHLL